jgi:L-fucose isomerase
MRAPIIMATENDCLNGVCMLFGYLLTNTAQVFADVRTYWSADAVQRVTKTKLSGRCADGFIHLINSGSAALDGTGEQRFDGKPAMKPFWDISEAEAAKCLHATSWPAAIYEYFRGGGFSSCFRSRGGMPTTMSRISLVKGLGPILQIAEGWTVDVPAKAGKMLEERTNPTWPTTWFVPRLTGTGAFSDVYSVMNNWSANHGSISYGHIGADLVALAALLRIPVAMHNIDNESLFRPSAWGLFGAMEPQSADYRACETFGPLYGKA